MSKMKWAEKAVLLKDYAKTDVQKNTIDTVIKHNSVGKAARELGVVPKTVRDILNTVWKYYEKNNSNKSFDFRNEQKNKETTVAKPDSRDYMIVKGVSELRDADGNIIMEWVKQSVDAKAYAEAIETAINAMKQEIKPIKIDDKLYPNTTTDDKLLTQYIITDYHLGMLAWAEETGDDWDINIAEKLLLKYFKKAISDSPASKYGLLVNLGDFLHYDSLEAITPTSGHILDVDSRYQKIVRVAIKLMRQIVNMMLQKHEIVKIIMAEGNHDIASSAWLREMFSALYEGNERIIVDTSPNPYYCHKHGKTLLFYHHGHKKKMNGIHDVFVSMFRKEFGNAEHVYAHLGHYHHTHQIENQLMVIEQHRTLIANDAYAARGGWLSGRSASTVVYHTEFGEVERKVYSFEYVNSLPD